LLGSPFGLLAGLALRFSGRRAGLVLVYHRVQDPQGDPERELVPAFGTALFKAQLGHLEKRYDVVAPSEILAATRRRRRGDRFPVAITFDDDLRSHTEVAMPTLMRIRLPAAFFICGASLEEPFAFWWERLQNAVDRELADMPALRVGDARSIHEVGIAIEAMTPEERDTVSAALSSRIGPDPGEAGMRTSDVQELAAAGFEIGFHTLRHDVLPALDDERLERAMDEGRERLADVVHAPITMIAYPHGRWDARVVDHARAAGYGLGFTCEPEPVTHDGDPLALGRVEPAFSMGSFALQLAGTLVRRHS
jgi:peptidoglycan/xylan/chitin deacetylase (PgdA/CDA1 family)